VLSPARTESETGEMPPNLHVKQVAAEAQKDRVILPKWEVKTLLFGENDQIIFGKTEGQHQ